MDANRKKLIEVALPLEAINKEAAREKSIRHGHPSTLHLWWARRPLAAARAVIFAQMVDDPGSVPEDFPTAEEQETERQRLFRLIEELVKWENTTNEPLLEQARAEIRRSWARWCKESGEDPGKLPPFHDPFAGGGALPLEAQRLGLEAYATDLNPVAVMINKAMSEIRHDSPESPQSIQKREDAWADLLGRGEERPGLLTIFATTANGCEIRRRAVLAIYTRKPNCRMAAKRRLSHGSGPARSKAPTQLFVVAMCR